jgi:hypothetical protein
VRQKLNKKSNGTPVVHRLDHPTLKHVAKACQNPFPTPDNAEYQIFSSERKRFWATTFTLHGETFHLISFKDWRMHSSDNLSDTIEGENFFLIFYKGKAYNAREDEGQLIVNALKKKVLPEIYCLLYGQSTSQTG